MTPLVSAGDLLERVRSAAPPVLLDVPWSLEVAGWPGAALYPPSWSGWIADPRHEVERS